MGKNKPSAVIHISEMSVNRKVERESYRFQ